MPDLKEYSGSSIGNLPIGQGLAVTPVQLAAAYGAIANCGLLIAPHVVSKVADRPARPRRGRRVISARTAAEVRDMLRGVVGPEGPPRRPPSGTWRNDGVRRSASLR